MALGSEQDAPYPGAKVADRDGQRVGRVAEIYPDPSTGEPEWALISSGRFGHGSALVPIEGAEMDGAALCLPYAAPTIRNAPRVPPFTSLSDKQKRGLRRYYQAATRHRPPTSRQR